MINIENRAVASLLAPYGIAPSAALFDQIRAYSDLLLRWNQKISLTTVTDPAEIIRFHFGESLFALSTLSPIAGRLADLGSGAGFPGLALKLAAPELHVTLIESNVKKTTFLSEVIRSLSLKNVEVFRGRLEDFPASRDPFTLVTARALGSHKHLLSWTHGHLVPKGRIALWLGGEDVSTISREPLWVWSRPSLIPATKSRFILAGYRSE